jgi:hypothetical protein
MDLRVRRGHLELFDDRWHTYCGIDLFGIPPARAYVRELPPDLCRQCRAVFDRLVDVERSGADFLEAVQDLKSSA